MSSNMTATEVANRAPLGARTDSFAFWWLIAMAVLVAIMVLIGGVTRLTGSGLSMVEWRPLMGTLPPLTDAEWSRVYQLYVASPEYDEFNYGMDLAGFKAIFFWEYVHRLWGRLLGLAFVVPFVWLILRRRVPNGFGGRLFLLLLLGGSQGVIGWWMVKSGLTADATVSQYRLAVHLGMALLIFALLLWTAFDIRYGRAGLPRGHAAGTLGIVAITILAGALVAGMDAGLLYNHYPFMGNGLIPVEYGEMGAMDAFENPAAAQFHHRWIAVLAVLAVITLAFRGRRQAASRGPATLAILLVGAQFILGIAVLLNGVPLSLGAMHQTGAVLLLATVLWTAHRMAR
jgi:cytochrome c oxidase assembly protein subunit 15